MAGYYDDRFDAFAKERSLHNKDWLLEYDDIEDAAGPLGAKERILPNWQDYTFFKAYPTVVGNVGDWPESQWVRGVRHEYSSSIYSNQSPTIMDSDDFGIRGRYEKLSAEIVSHYPLSSTNHQSVKHFGEQPCPIGHMSALIPKQLVGSQDNKEVGSNAILEQDHRIIAYNPTTYQNVNQRRKRGISGRPETFSMSARAIMERKKHDRFTPYQREGHLAHKGDVYARCKVKRELLEDPEFLAMNIPQQNKKMLESTIRNAHIFMSQSQKAMVNRCQDAAVQERYRLGISQAAVLERQAKESGSTHGQNNKDG
ncbi:MAG: hypothetical protein M1818_004845 [Claussenomyces sp. TS43310]|nr:MAG: hypothetical protein M1818_004845 [Claussenomyces sp. TS43310]